MKPTPVWALCACLALLASFGCGHLELANESDPNRVVTGVVSVRMDLLPPSDAEIVVRIVEPSDMTAAPVGAGGDLVIGEGGTRSRPENVIGEQIIRDPKAMPASFRIEFRASDTALRRGLNIEARISWGGKVRFRTVESQVLTLGNIGGPQTVRVEAVQ